MRVVKDAEERKNEIMEAAEQLFAAKGFDGTSTNDILAAVGIARGTLYYHFKSKEDIMNALIERYHAQVIEAARVTAADKSIPVVERLFSTLTALKITSSGQQLVIKQIKKPQNALMQQKMQRVIINSVPPILAEIIEEGIEQDVFRTKYPYECVEMIVIYASILFDSDMITLTQEQTGQRINALIGNIELMLGAKSGSLRPAINLFT